MTKVCRLCLQKLQRGSKYFNINAVESFTGFMPYRDQLTTCIPEMALDLIPTPVICNSCRTALKSAYEFKSRCLLVERKIRDYVENQSDNANCDLSQISILDLPPIVPTNPVKETTSNETNNSELLMQLQKDIILPQTGEIEITDVTSRRRVIPPKRKLKLEWKEGAITCSRCDVSFPDIGKLLLHKAIHGDDFICNFCNRSFKSLQYLRKHNSICSKMKTVTNVNPILTKRPHLPTKAKNHLKRWLFRHTDHPYPTDHEKQILMQETNLSLLQVENWFINARRRILQDLTKLKMHGARCDDIGDDELDMQELQQSLLPNVPLNSTASEEKGGYTEEEVAESAAPTFTPVDIMQIKKKILDDRTKSLNYGIEELENSPLPDVPPSPTLSEEEGGYAEEEDPEPGTAFTSVHIMQIKKEILDDRNPVVQMNSRPPHRELRFQNKITKLWIQTEFFYPLYLKRNFDQTQGKDEPH